MEFDHFKKLTETNFPTSHINLTDISLRPKTEYVQIVFVQPPFYQLHRLNDNTRYKQFEYIPLHTLDNVVNGQKVTPELVDQMWGD